jgi:hypothetical protein
VADVQRALELIRELAQIAGPQPTGRTVADYVAALERRYGQYPEMLYPRPPAAVEGDRIISGIERLARQHNLGVITDAAFIDRVKAQLGDVDE